VFAQTYKSRALISPQVWIIEHKLTLAAHEGAKPQKPATIASLSPQWHAENARA